MFFKKKPYAPPAVKVRKASDIISNHSHKQKKYISLMLVPSYTNGKTRSLRVPRAVFYCVIVLLFVVSAVIAGLQIRANYLMDKALHYSGELDKTLEEFFNHVWESEYELNNWIVANQEAISQLSDEQIERRIEEARMRREHQERLDEIQRYLNTLEQQIEEFSERHAAAIAGLSTHQHIPPVAALLKQLQQSQDELWTALESISFESVDNYAYEEDDDDIFAVAGVAEKLGSVVQLGAQSLALPPPINEADLHAHIESLLFILEVQAQIVDEFEQYRERIAPHALNHPSRRPGNLTFSSPFGWRSNPFGGGTEFHRGIDFSGPVGSQIRAAGGGTVVVSAYMTGGYGNVVKIDHGFGLVTMYAHNSVNLVSEGQRVERGDVIALVGTTGRVTGPHVHYEVHRNGVPVNPVEFFLE